MIYHVRHEKVTVWIKHIFQPVVSIGNAGNVDPLPVETGIVNVGPAHRDALKDVSAAFVYAVVRRMWQRRIEVIDVDQTEASFRALGHDAANTAVGRSNAQIVLGNVVEMDVVVTWVVGKVACEPI